MGTEHLLLSDKYKAFLRCDAPVEFLEGTTAAGKTTVGLFTLQCIPCQKAPIPETLRGRKSLRTKDEKGWAPRWRARGKKAFSELFSFPRFLYFFEAKPL